MRSTRINEYFLGYKNHIRDHEKESIIRESHQRIIRHLRYTQREIIKKQQAHSRKHQPVVCLNKNNEC